MVPVALNHSLPSNMPSAVGEIRFVPANLLPKFHYMSEALPMPREGTPLQREEREVLHRRRAKWDELLQAHGSSISSTCTIHTNVTSVTLPVNGALEWPRLIDSPILHFPATQQGGTTSAYISVKNKGPKPVWLQLVDHADVSIQTAPEASIFDGTASEKEALGGARSD
eukprot:5474277-Prymnesium_polylepis.1